jgi:hypothetical protein
MSPSNSPDDEAALLAHEHESDDPHPGYEPDDPRDLPGVADPATRELLRELMAKVRARQAARRERELDE